ITALIVILLPRDIATGMVLIGLWFVSRTDEISMIGRSRRHGLIPVSLTSTLRAGIVLLVASGIASSIIGLVLSANMREWLYAPVRSESWDRLTLVLDLSSVVTAIGAFVVVVGGLLCLSRLAARLPDQVMARRFRRWAWLLPLLFVVGTVPSVALLDGDYELVGSAVTVLVYVALLIQSSRLTKSLGNRIKALASESSPNREPSPAVANHT
ncbi:MAG: hypothetical protein KF768_14455, partial [Phycisphaeraceae bacterium]|nr:hypothetical protein [Phycisphaeraceae bacterium]